MATAATITTTTTAAAAGVRTVRLFVDDSTERVVLAEAGEDAVAFILSVLADPRASVKELLREDPAFAAAGCYANLAAFETLLLRSGPSSLAPAPPRDAARWAWMPAGKGGGIMAYRLFRCDHLGCPCSDVASRAPGSACPCASCAAGGRRGTELHFLDACFYHCPDGSAVTVDTFYPCKARDDSRALDFSQCRYRVTDERGVLCPLCHDLTSVEVKCGKGDGGRSEPAGAGSSCRYAILDDLTVRPVSAGISVAALLSSVGVTADPAALREVDVALGYKEGFGMISASLHCKTVLTNIFGSAIAGAGAAPRRRRRRRRVADDRQYQC